jgi:hypothetical protein
MTLKAWLQHLLASWLSFAQLAPNRAGICLTVGIDYQMLRSKFVLAVS